MNRRKKTYLVIVFIVICLAISSFIAFDFLIGKFDSNISLTDLSEDTKKYVDSLLVGIDQNEIVDYHAHLIGVGHDNSGCYVNEKMESCIHLKEHFKFRAYLQASGVNDLENIDSSYLQNLIRLKKDALPKGKLVLLAFDQVYNISGDPVKSQSTFFVPNDYLFTVYRKFPQDIIPCISIHPNRKDAIQEIERFAEKGAKFLKWLPNAMQIDPSDSTYIPFYQALIKHNITLLTHVGHEKAVESDEFQKFGNPLLLRLPLDLGVKIQMAHCASFGESIDIENEKMELVPSFNLFCRLMNEEKYKENLFGDISAITLENRDFSVLDTLLHRQDWHQRLLNGSDYPLPAINFLIKLDQFCEAGYITKYDQKHLKKVYEVNPLMFDLLLKIAIHIPNNEKLKFQYSVFMTNPNLN